MNEEKLRYRPIGLWRYGCEFVTTAHDALACHRKREKEGRHPNRSHVPSSKLAPFPIYYNFLHGIELGLKAYLLYVDAVPLTDLRRYGHHLDHLLKKAICHDLRNVCPELTDSHIDTTLCLSGSYAKKEFEYIQPGGAQLMPINQVVEVAETLIAGLGAGIFPEQCRNGRAGDLPWLKKATSPRKN